MNIVKYECSFIEKEPPPHDFNHEATIPDDIRRYHIIEFLSIIQNFTYHQSSDYFDGVNVNLMFEISTLSPEFLAVSVTVLPVGDAVTPFESLGELLT